MLKNKVIIFDSSTLISLSLSGLLPNLIEFKKIFPGKFIIPKEVKYEIIERPIKIKRFELEALRMKDLLKREIIELPESVGISNETIAKKTKELMTQVNSTFFEKQGNNIELIHSGETACMALSQLLTEQEIPNILAVDERTTKLIIESAQDLKKFLQRKLHKKISFHKSKTNQFKNIKIIRSTELIYMIYKKNLIKIKDEKILEAVLYALKYSGCAISFDEIDRIKRLK